jgi:hydroxylaminobenzene mutase
MTLFLAALIVGLVIPLFAVPRLGLSTHLLGLMQGLLLVVLGLVWPGLHMTHGTGRVGVLLASYGCLSAWSANLMSAIWGAGNSMLPMAAGPARGSSLQEAMIMIALRSAAMALIAATLIVLWGLRGSHPPQDVRR